MKKLFILLPLLAGFFVPFVPLHAEEIIKRFDVQADLTADRHLEVTETIQYDFDDGQRHGIYRIIPEVYDRNGAKYRLHLKFLEATMDGHPVPWSSSLQSGDDEIKIGDPDVTISGPHTYVFRYVTDRAINDFSDHQELYWNVTGNGWKVSIEQASILVHAPSAPNKTACYTGLYGNDAQDCLVRTEKSGTAIQSSRELGPYEGLTVALSFPLGTFRALTMWDKVRQFAMDNIVLFFPVIIFGLMLAAWIKWGKEPRGRGTIIAQYEEPEGLAPGLMAGLVEQRVSMRAVTATILDLARRGYLKIAFSEPTGWMQKKANFTLVKGKEPTAQDSLGFERTVWTGLFASGKERVSVNDVKGTFWKNEQAMRMQIFDELRTRGLFGRNPTLVRAPWLVLAGVVAFITFQFAGVFGAAVIVSGFLSAAIIAAFGWNMPRMTKRGAEVLEEIDGFKLFLSVTEEARLAFTDAPERSPEQFEKHLPAAVAFGVEKKWAGQFAGIDMRPPSYMEGPVQHWNALYFANTIGQLHEVSAAGLYRAPSSAGGGGSGFSGGGSGGGFGGGGGGSW